MSSQPSGVGVTGYVEFNGERYDFAHMLAQFEPNHAIFPASEGPRSIVRGTDETQREKYITAYEATDQYVNNLIQTNAQMNKEHAPLAQQLVQLTHCLHQTRQETDNVLTMAMNKNFPRKRKTLDQKNSDSMDESTKLPDEEGITEEVKRQRALDTTEYFSGSEDEGDDGKPENEKVQL